MGITKMSLSWILLATIPSCLASTLERIEQNDELYVVKHPTKNEVTCFSEDDDAALVWNDYLSTKKPVDDFNNFEPVKPVENILGNSKCAIWKSRQCFIEWSTSANWKRVSAVTNPMAPVYDFRWEGFEEFVVGYTRYPNVLPPDAKDGTIIFSIRGTKEVKIHLCKDTVVEFSSCPVIKFAVDGVYSSIEYCESQETGCQERKKTSIHENAFLDAHEWRTFRLQWTKNEQKIEVFRDTCKYPSLQSNLRELRKILISSSAVARIRFHDYYYILTTRQNSIMTTKEFDWSDHSSCVNMLVSLGSECHLTVSLIDSSSKEKLANLSIYRDDQFYSSGLREWQPVKLTLSSKGSSQRQVQLQFSAVLNNVDSGDVWWAIDDLRLCEQNDGVRKSTIKLPSSNQTGVGTNIKCQKLFRGKTAVADSSTSLPLNETTRLSKYVRNLTKSYPPGYRVSSTTNCDDINGTSDPKNGAGNESEALVAPPAEEDVQIYDADAFAGTISVRCKRLHPSFGEIESYQVSIRGRSQITRTTWLIHVSQWKTCGQPYVCIENLSLPSKISIEKYSLLQIFVENTNVSALGTVISQRFQLNDLYNKAPGEPEKLQAIPSNHGIVMLTWSHPSFTPTKIVRFKIQAKCLRSNLTTDPCKNIFSIYYNITNAEEKSYSTELHLQTSTEYRLHVMAFNYRNNISAPVMNNVATSGSVSFASKVEPKVMNAGDIVALEIPAVLNATRHTTIIVKVEGSSLCAPNSSKNESPSKNKTEITMHWDAVKYSVNSSQPVNLTFELNQPYGVQKTCRFQRMETYRFVVTLTDPALKEPLILETEPIAFTDKESPPEQIETWLVILIPILLICLLLLILLIWYRKHKKTKTQTIGWRGVPPDVRSSIPVNSRVRSSGAQDLPSDPVHTTSSENLERQTSSAQNVPFEPPYMIPRDLSEQASHLQKVASAPVYTNIPNDSMEESSHAQNVPSDPEYWEILDNSREQPSHPQDVAFAPIYMNTSDDSKGESTYSRDASLDPEYLIILDDSRGETSYAQDISLAPVYMNILNNSKEQTRHKYDTP